jgi:membrane-bound serine protease (ClpP class)
VTGLAVARSRASTTGSGLRAGYRRPAVAGALAASLLVVAVLLMAEGAARAQGSSRVLETRVADAITPVIADHLADAVERAEREGYEALVVRLDTPGGLVDSMRRIVQDFLRAEVPVIVYVSPAGARAASAGALITLAANVAAMAPGTNIGAATPVDLEGGEVGDKVVNDAAAYAEAIAEERGRNTEFAVASVREGESITSSRALRTGVVDIVATDLADLLEQADGMEVELGNGDRVTLATAGAAVDELELSFPRRIVQFLANPTVAFLLMSVGTLALIYELAAPGGGVAGVIGVIMLVLGLFSLAVLPVNVVGLLFLVLAAGLFVAEVLAPGIGAFAFLGAGSLLLAALFLFPRDVPGLEVSLAAVLPTVVVVGAAVVLAGRFAVRARRKPSRTGTSALVGRHVVVEQTPSGRAMARLDGTWWEVRTAAVPAPGAPADQAGLRGPARVVDVDELELVVEPAPPRTNGGAR